MISENIKSSVKGPDLHAVPNPKQSQSKSPHQTSASNPSLPLLTYTNDEGKSLLIPHESAAKFIYRKVFKSSLRLDSITRNWFRYDKDSGIFSVRPELSVKREVYQAICDNKGKLGLSCDYVKNVTTLFQLEAIRDFKTVTGKICFKNGVLDLKTRKLSPHSPEYGFISALPFNWEPNSPEPKPVIDWMRSAVGHDDQVEVLRAFLNAIIVGRSDLQRFLEITGFGGSGKGTFTRLCVAMVGNSSILSTDLKQLETNRFETAKIFGKKLVLIADAEKWGGDVSVLKSITGQDPVRFEEKNKQAGESFTYGGMVLIVANQHTTSTDYSSGIQRRRIPMAFDNVVPAEKRRDLEAEFEPLLPAVARWALSMSDDDVTGYLRDTSSRVRSLEAFRLESLAATNSVVGWLRACTVFDKEASTQIGDRKKLNITSSNEDGNKETRTMYENWDSRLYPNYCKWCDENIRKPISLGLFSRTVIDMSMNTLKFPFVKLVKKHSARTIAGIRLHQKGEGWGRSGEGLGEGYPIEREEDFKGEGILKGSIENPQPVDSGSDAPNGSDPSIGITSDLGQKQTSSSQSTTYPSPKPSPDFPFSTSSSQSTTYPSPDPWDSRIAELVATGMSRQKAEDQAAHEGFGPF
jgi:putative DNA primase/helicase